MLEFWLDTALDCVHTRADLAKFIRLLRADMRAFDEMWENVTLDRYFEAAGRWLEDQDDRFDEMEMADSGGAPWRAYAGILWAAGIIE